MSHFDFIINNKNINVKIKESFGESPDDIVGTDTTINYIIGLLQKNKPLNENISITESITTIASLDIKTPLHSSDLLSIENVSTRLVNTYIFLKNKMVSGVIYSALNAGSYTNGESHQNWLCLDLNSNTLLRFEPSDDIPKFRTSEFCKLVISKLNKLTGIDWKYSIPFNKYLNTFCACRVYSTLLVSMYIKKISFKYLDKFLDSKGYGKEIYTKPLSYIIQNDYLNNMSDLSIKKNRTSRINKNIIFGHIIL